MLANDKSPGPIEFWKEVERLSDVIFWEATQDGLISISPGVSRLLGQTPEALTARPSLWADRIYPRHPGRGGGGHRKLHKNAAKFWRGWMQRLG
ncbi:MAG: hypothetical protein ABI577_09565 [bacterium]